MYMYGAGNTKYSADGKRKNNAGVITQDEFDNAKKQILN